jgi:hypothetical protein
MIICGDMNNSACMCISIKGKLKDSFEEAGKGFEKPISSDIIQFDYIFADENESEKFENSHNS